MYEVIFAYIAVILMLSTMVTAILEVVKRLTPLRAYWFKRTFMTLMKGLGSNTVEGQRALWNHFCGDPLINPGARRRIDHINDDLLKVWLKERGGVVSTEDEGNEESGAPGSSDRGESPRLELSPSIRKMLGDSDDVFGDWIVEFNSAANQGYKSMMVMLSFVLGLGMAWAVGIDGAGLAEHLRREPEHAETLAALVSGADEDGGGTPRPSGTVERYLDVLDAELAGAVTCGDPKDTNDPDACVDRLRAISAVARAREEETKEAADWERVADEVEGRIRALRRMRSRAGDPAAWHEAAKAAVDEVVKSRVRDPESFSDDEWVKSLRSGFRAKVDANKGPLDAYLWLDACLERAAKDGGEPSLVAFHEALYGPEVRADVLLDAATLGKAETAAASARETMADLTEERLGFNGIWLADNPFVRLLGYLVIAALVALGAPFWFDVLSRVQQVRNPGRKKEGSADSAAAKVVVSGEESS